MHLAQHRDQWRVIVFGLRKMWGISWLAEWLLDSQEGLCSIELFVWSVSIVMSAQPATHLTRIEPLKHPRKNIYLTTDIFVSGCGRLYWELVTERIERADFIQGQPDLHTISACHVNLVWRYLRTEEGTKCRTRNKSIICPFWEKLLNHFVGFLCARASVPVTPFYINRILSCLPVLRVVKCEQI